MFIQLFDKYGQRNRYIVIIYFFFVFFVFFKKKLDCYKRPIGSSSLELELDKVSASGTLVFSLRVLDSGLRYLFSS